MLKINNKVKFLLIIFCSITSYSSTQTCELADKLKTIGLEKIIVPLLRRIKSRNKRITIMVYIAADNNLHLFAWKNIRQLAKISPENANIIVLLAEPGKHKKTQIYLIEKDKAYLLNQNNTEKQDSGNPETLINFCKFSIENYPAHKYALILWNHGTGALDPVRGRAINPVELFVLNPETLKYDVDRSIPFLEGACDEKISKGICFDETFNSYINNQKLIYALETIKTKFLNNQKLAIIGLDACLMGMVEVASMLKNYANVMVGSEEVELGSGWRYDLALKTISDSADEVDEINVARCMVQAYKEAYERITNDYTLSAIDLRKMQDLENAVNDLATSLIECLTTQSNKSCRQLFKKTHAFRFDEPSFVDLHSFCDMLLKNMDQIKLQKDENQTKATLKTRLMACISILKNVVIANESGSSATFANGLSIYLPTQSMHPSYPKTTFSSENNWYKFLTALLYS